MPILVNSSEFPPKARYARGGIVRRKNTTNYQLLTNNSFGFTLIELLIVITILGILSVVGLTSYGGLTGKTQDTKRKADVDVIAKAYELKYDNRNYQYRDLNDGDFATGKPKDPKTDSDYPVFWDSETEKTVFRVCAVLSGGSGDSCNSTSPNTCYCKDSVRGDISLIAGLPTPGSVTSAPPPPAAPTIAITTLDNNAAFYGTYQSHNQKVVSNQNGIFMTYVHTTFNKDQFNESDTWRLARSTDGGSTFTTLKEATSGTRAPVIETDSSNNIYLIQADWLTPGSSSYFYKFSPSNNYASPTVQTTLSLGTISAKYAMEIDEARSRLYYFTLGNNFTVISFSGTIISQYQLTSNDTSTSSTGSGQTQMHYPFLYLDENGYLYAAWTTTYCEGPMGNCEIKNLYWSIHFIRSRDGGTTWEKPTGLTTGVTLVHPIIADESGPSIRITLDDEFEVHTWLETFLVKSDKVHFMYYARDPKNRMHYVRYNLTTASIDLNIYPTFSGETISLATLDGFCTTGPSTQNIYCVGKSISPYAVAVLKSGDNGVTWHDHSISSTQTDEIYALGGSPQVTSDGYIIGSYTQSSNFSDPSVPKIVKFFKVGI